MAMLCQLCHHSKIENLDVLVQLESAAALLRYTKL